MSELYTDLTHTTFPNSIDSMPYFENITSGDLANVNMFHYYLKMGDFAAASNILSQIDGYDKKFIDSGKLNKFRDALIAMERYYKSDIEPFVKEKQNEWQSIMNEFVYMGSWNISSTYIKNNIVSYEYGNDTYMYIAKKDIPSNINIDNEEYWTLFSVKGEIGLSGENGAYKYEFLENQPYIKNDIVSYNNCLWAALKNTTGVIPTTENSEDWELLLKIPPISAPLQSEKPTDLVNGDLWFEVIS